MARKRTTYEMVELYLKRMTPRQIGEIYGVSASAVGERLKRMGYSSPYRRLRSVTATVDKNRLEILYAAERLSYDRIAAEFGVSVKVIRKALEFYGVPKRPTAYWGGRYRGLLRRLRVGETTEILYRDRNQIETLRQSAQNLGMLISIHLAGENFIKVSRITEDEPRRLSAITGINRGRLAELYSEQKLSPAVIGRYLGVGADLIEQALDFYSISRRPTGGKYRGKYTSVFGKLGVGETSEIECAAKYPHTNLHSIAFRLGMKISMRKIADRRYKITRLL